MQTVPVPHNRLLISLFLLLLVALTAIPAPDAHGADLRIIYSNDIRGELEPCG